MISHLAFGVGFAVLAVAALSLVYHLLPYRPLPEARPRLTLLPKYRVAIAGDPEALQRAARAAGFSEGRPGTWHRGSFFGDFSARLARLTIRIVDQHFFIGSGGTVILFDTGDLWQIASDLNENAA